MTQIASVIGSRFTATPLASSFNSTRTPRLLVLEDEPHLSNSLHGICEFLEITVERVPTHADLAPILASRQPMGIIAQMDAPGQDGCHVMKCVAAYDPSLPILLLTGPEHALVGAADAVEELWGLSAVRKSPTLPELGNIVEFLFYAGQHGNCLNLMPA